MTLRQWLQEQVHLVVWSLSIHHASVALGNLFFRICGGTKGFLHGFFYIIYVRLYKRLDLEAVSGAKCETSDGTAWLPRHMFTRRRRQKELHAQNISWRTIACGCSGMFWASWRIWSFLGLSFHSFGCRGPNAWWQVGNLATMLLEYARKLGGGIRKLENCIWKLGIENSWHDDLREVNTAQSWNSFSPIRFSWFQQKHAKAAMAITVKVSMPTKVLLREGGEFDPSWF